MAQPRSYRSFASCHGGGNTWAVDRSGYNSRENKSSSCPAAKQWIFESSVRNDRVPFCARVQELKYWQPKVIPDDARTKICVNKESPRSGITWRQEYRQHSIKEAVRFSWRKRFTKTTCIAIILTRFSHDSRSLHWTTGTSALLKETKPLLLKIRRENSNAKIVLPLWHLGGSAAFHCSGRNRSELKAAHPKLCAAKRRWVLGRFQECSQRCQSVVKRSLAEPLFEELDPNSVHDPNLDFAKPYRYMEIYHNDHWTVQYCFCQRPQTH